MQGHSMFHHGAEVLPPQPALAFAEKKEETLAVSRSLTVRRYGRAQSHQQTAFLLELVVR